MASDRSVDADGIRGGPAARTGGAEAHLVGRERELEEFGRCLDDPDGPCVVLVRGERGSGRSAFAHAAAARLRARNHMVVSLACVDGDHKRPLLLALRVVAAVREHRSAAARQRAAGRHDRCAEMVSAAERGGKAAFADMLLSELAHAAPVGVVLDDAQYADAASVDVLRAVAAWRPAPDVRLVVTAVRHTAEDGRAAPGRPASAVERLAGYGTALTIALPRLTTGQVTGLVARRLQALPDAALLERVLALTRGIPAAADALLTAWAAHDAIRVADGHAFLATGAPVPVLPDEDRFIRALYELGEPCRTVAAALSVLWPLGRTAVTLAAECTGLSGQDVRDGIGRLVAAGLLDELPGRDGDTAVRGWTFRSPLVEHAVRERFGPLGRGRLSAAAVEALWTARDAAGGPRGPAGIVEEADAKTYLPDRIADAGNLLDRDRAVAELTAAADALYPDPEDRGMLRWLRAALRLVEDPAARELTLLRCAKTAWVVGDHQTAGRTAETILHDPSAVLSGPELQEIANLLVAATAAGKDWARLSQMGMAQWWAGLPLPPVAAVPAQALALCLTERWQESLDLLSRTEAAWNTDSRSRLLPELARAVGNMVQGRPEALARALSQPLPLSIPPDLVYATTVAHCDMLFSACDLAGVTALLTARALPPEALMPYGRFLLLHLQGRWDEALALARWLYAKDQAFAPTPHHHLFAARTAAILTARGKPAAATRLIAAARGPEDSPLEVFLDAADAAVLTTLGRPEAAERTLRLGLRAADAHSYVHGTDELSAALAVLHADAGRADEAAACLRRLADLAGRTGGARTRLLYLLAAARVLGPGSDDARKMLHEAVELARSRNQPFETAATLAAAAQGVGSPDLLGEAYELFGETGSALRRFRTRAAMREAGLAVPNRRQATAENEQLLATLLTEGLANRQIATVLQLSEDAVANRLTRLFARTGLRSRTELVSAMLTGDPRAPAGR